MGIEKGIEQLAKKELRMAKDRVAELEDEAKGFVKKNRYYFIAGAFALGFIVGLVVG